VAKKGEEGEIENEHDNDNDNDNLESSRSPRARVCSQIEDRRGDLLECWTKSTTEVAQVWEKYLGGEV
jgi:hypothetical protein